MRDAGAVRIVFSPASETGDGEKTMTLKELEQMKAAENVALDAMIEIRRILDKAKADYKKAGGEREWDEVEEEIKNRVFEE